MFDIFLDNTKFQLALTKLYIQKTPIKQFKFILASDYLKYAGSRFFCSMLKSIGPVENSSKHQKNYQYSPYSIAGLRSSSIINHQISLFDIFWKINWFPFTFKICTGKSSSFTFCKKKNAEINKRKDFYSSCYFIEIQLFF